MTAFALDYRADQLTVAADSRIYHGTTTIGHGAKIHALPHLRSVLLMRGLQQVTHGAVARLLLDPQILSIEDAARKLPAILTELADNVLASLGYEQIGENNAEICQAVLVGWSAAEQRMRMFAFVSNDNYEAHDTYDRSYSGVAAWPNIPASYMPLDRAADSMDTKLTAVLRAVDKFCEENPEHVGGARLGGMIQKTVVTESTISTTAIGTIEDRVIH
jgi:hypothetical protein